MSAIHPETFSTVLTGLFSSTEVSVIVRGITRPVRSSRCTLFVPRSSRAVISTGKMAPGEQQATPECA